MTPRANAERLLDRMTVDFGMDEWRSRECARVACQEVIAVTEGEVRDLWIATLRILSEPHIG